MKIYLAGLFIGIRKKDMIEYDKKTNCLSGEVLESYFYIDKKMDYIKQVIEDKGKKDEDTRN